MAKLLLTSVGKSVIWYRCGDGTMGSMFEGQANA